MQQLHAIAILVTSVQHTCAPYKMVTPCFDACTEWDMQAQWILNTIYLHYILVWNIHTQVGRHARMQSLVHRQPRLKTVINTGRIWIQLLDWCRICLVNFKAPVTLHLMYVWYGGHDIIILYGHYMLNLIHYSTVYVCVCVHTIRVHLCICCMHVHYIYIYNIILYNLY